MTDVCHACSAAAPDPYRIEVAARSPNDPIGYVPPDPRYRVCTLCESCFERLDPDMWSCRNHYQGLSPATPFESLPILEAR